MELNEIRFSAIACVSKSGGIGFQDKLLFNIKNDMKHFKETTENHIVVMGRKTFESIGKPLPNRFNIVISKNAMNLNFEFKNKGWTNTIAILDINDIESIVNNIQCIHDEFYRFDISHIDLSSINFSEIFVIGGQLVYKYFENYIDKYYLTIVDSEKEYDTFLPIFKEKICKYNCLDNMIISDKDWIYKKSENFIDQESGLKYLTMIMIKIK